MNGTKVHPAEGRANGTKLQVSKEPEVSVNDDRFFRFKLLKQTCLCSLLTCLGLCVATIGPTLPDIRDRLGVDYEAVSNAMIFDSVGNMLGSVLGGALHDSFPRRTDLFLSAGFAGVAATYIAVPWAPTLEVLSALLFFGGLAKGNIDIGTNTAVLHMWGVHAAAPMHSLHFAFGVGALSAPQVARFFVGESQDPDEDQPEVKNPEVTEAEVDQVLSGLKMPGDDTGFLAGVWMNTSGTPGIVDDSSIEWSFLIVGATTAVFAAIYVIFHFYGFPRGFPERVPTRLNLSMCSFSGCGRGSTVRGAFYLVLLFFLFFNTVGGELAYATFIYSFATDKEDPLSTGDAANLNTVFFACFTGGRGLGVLVSKFISTDTMLLLDVLLYVASSVILLLWGYDDVTVLWVFTGMTGLFISVLYPAGMAWANKYLDVNGMLVMVLVVGANIGVLCYKYSTGALFDSKGPESLLYVNLVAATLTATTFIIMFFVTWKDRKNLKKRIQN